MSPRPVLISLITAAGVLGALAWYSRELHFLRSQTALGNKPTVATSDNLTSNTTLEANARLTQKAVRDETRIAQLDAENADLRRQLAEARQAAKPPPTPDELGMKITTQRGLNFPKKPTWSPVTLEEIEKRITDRALVAITQEAGQLRARAYRAMGWVQDSFDYQQAMASLDRMKAGGYYDATSNQFLYQADASLLRADGRESFVAGLIPALLAQNFPLAAQSWVATDNDDAARAAQSLTHGDANFTRIRFSISDQLNTNFDKGQAPMAPPPTYNAPPFLGEAWKFTEDQGATFIETLHANGGTARVNAAYARPPKSTTEIMHPEKTYLANPPFEPEALRLPEMSVKPIFSNVAGELGTYLLLRSFADLEFSTTASEGWAGDRYEVFAGNPKTGDHTIWRTKWITPLDAKEFFDAMRRISMQRYSIPWQKEYDTSPSCFRINELQRQLHITIGADQRTVTVLDATDPAFTAGAEAALGK